MRDEYDFSDGFKPLEEILRTVRTNRERSNKRKREKRKRVIKFDEDSRKDVFQLERKWSDGLNKKAIDDALESNLSKEFFLAATCLNDHHITLILDRRIKLGLETIHEKETFVSNSNDWISYIRKRYSVEDGYQLIQFSHTAGMVIDDNDFIDYTTNSNSIEVKIYGSREFVEETKNELCSQFSVATCYIEWVYGSDGSSLNIPLLGEKLPISEMYPFLGEEKVTDYYKRFLDSSASILLLIGPPGTGKTTFIRGLLHYTAKNAIVTYDETILQKDYVFARFMEDDTGIMVIEDADAFLKSRSDGNSMMHRFLNVGDGLITVKGKKLVFSTNLPSTKEIDPALIRPGRCFDILEFRNYKPQEAKALAKKLDIDFNPKEKSNYSLAEIFHEQRNNIRSATKMGFL